MNLRYNIDSSGRIFLEQSISKDDSLWEKIPVTGLGHTASFTSPLESLSGIFLIEEIGFRRSETHKSLLTHVVSALSIKSVNEIDENSVIIYTHEKEMFKINISNLEFIKLLTQSLISFMVIKIDSEGNLKGIDYGQNSIEEKTSKKRSRKQENLKKGEKDVRIRTSKRTSKSSGDRNHFGPTSTM